MVSANILLIITERSVAHELQKRLVKLGYGITGVVSSEEDALVHVQASRPDLVMVDARLGAAGGGEGQAGSQIQTACELPVIYIVEDVGRNTIEHSRAMGLFGYVYLPFDDRQILVTVESALTRHQLERELRKSRQWFANALTSTGEGVIIVDEQGKVQFINPVAREYTGWTDAEAIGKPLTEVFLLVDEDSHEPSDEPLIGVEPAEPISSQGFEGVLLPRGGNAIPVSFSINSIKDEKGQAGGTVLVFRDVAQLKETMHEIRRQAVRAEALVQVASQLNSQFELKSVLDTICKIAESNTKAAGVAVFLQDQQKDTFKLMAAISHIPAFRAFHGIQFEISKEVFLPFLSREHPIVQLQGVQDFPNLPYHDVFRNVNIRTLVIDALFYESDLIGALILAFTQPQKDLPDDEITFLRGLADQASTAINNAELFEQVRAGRERQRNLTKSLVDIQEAERRHIAKELHDHLGQLLTGLQFMLETAKKQAEGPQRTHLEEIQESVSDVIRQVREMSLNLRPSMLDDLGLVPTLLWHIDRYTNQTGIRVNFHSDPFPKRLPLEIETAAYRIIQEALTNIARHAHVNEVFAGLVLQDNTLWLEVLDNGKGFDVASASDKPSSGLGGMRERASLLGGYLVVQSFIDQGTQIVAALPLAGQPLERRKHGRHHTAGR